MPDSFVVIGAHMVNHWIPGKQVKAKTEVAELATLIVAREGSQYQPTGLPAKWPEAFALTAIEQLTTGGATVDVWAHDTLRLLGALDFWKAAEAGFFLFKQGRWRGKAITTDPPVRLVCRVASTGGTLQIADCKNLGISTDDEPSDAYGRAKFLAERLSEWFTFVASEDLGGFRHTIAAQAWAAYRHRFLKHPLLCHNNQAVLQLEQDAIFQGRTECYRLGRIKGPVIQLDYKSYYPSLAIGQRFPARLRKLIANPSIAELRSIPVETLIIAEVDVETDQPDYPHKHDGITIYPIGRFTGVLCGGELDHALSLGRVKKVRQMALYDGEKCLDGFFEWALLYRHKAKRRGDKAGERVAKLLTNSLIGMFAKQDRQWRDSADLFSESPWNEWYELGECAEDTRHCRALAGLTQWLEVGGFSHESVPAITAWMTMLGRIRMHETIDAATLGAIYYVGTDSIYCNMAALEHLTRRGYCADGVNGKLQYVNGFEWIEVFGINHYLTPERSTDSGVPRGAGSDQNSIRDWLAPERISAALKRNEPPDGSVVPKFRGPTGLYRHGNVSASGMVSPILLRDWRD